MPHEPMPLQPYLLVTTLDGKFVCYTVPIGTKEPTLYGDEDPFIRIPLEFRGPDGKPDDESKRLQATLEVVTSHDKLLKHDTPYGNLVSAIAMLVLNTVTTPQK